MPGEKSRTPVFLVADNVVVREGLRWLIGGHGGFRVVNTNGEAFPAVRTRDGARVAVIVRVAPGLNRLQREGRQTLTSRACRRCSSPPGKRDRTTPSG